MNTPERQPYYFYLNCPFCNQLVVKSLDYSLLSDYVEDEEQYDEIIEDPDSIFDSCPHTAFLFEWGYREDEINEVWESEMRELYYRLSAREDDNDKDDLKEYDRMNATQFIADIMLEDPDTVEQALSEMFPEGTYKVVNKYVEANDGIKGSGGPTYLYIFLKEKMAEKQD